MNKRLKITKNRTCIYCGNKTTIYGEYCIQCGTFIGNEQPKYSPEEDPKRFQKYLTLFSPEKDSTIIKKTKLASSVISWTCVSCGFKNNGKNNFCGNCGAKKPEIPKCPNCGAKLNGKYSFCTNCGVKIIGTVQHKENEMGESKKQLAAEEFNTVQKSIIEDSELFTASKSKSQNLERCGVISVSTYAEEKSDSSTLEEENGESSTDIFRVFPENNKDCSSFETENFGVDLILDDTDNNKTAEDTFTFNSVHIQSNNESASIPQKNESNVDSFEKITEPETEDHDEVFYRFENSIKNTDEEEAELDEVFSRFMEKTNDNTTEKSVICPICGCILNYSEGFCEQCGNKLSAGQNYFR